MKEWLYTLKLSRYRGDLTIWEFHIWRMYQKYVRPKLNK